MQKYYPQLIFLFLALICIGFRKAGYLFLLDDSLYLQDYNWAYEKIFQLTGSVIWIVVDWCNHIIPGRITQRLFYITTLFLLGLGGFQLCRRIFPDVTLGAYFAGVFLMINPWVYGRVMDGQIFIPLSLAFLTRGLSFLFSSKFLQKSLVSGLCFGVAIWCTSHSVFFVGLIYLVHLLNSLLRNKGKCNQKCWKAFLLSGFASIAINLHRLLPMLVGQQSEFAVMQSFDDRHIEAFASNSGNTNVYLATAGGFGFRGEKQGRFMTIQATNEQARLILFAMIFAIVLYGVYRVYTQKSYHVLFFFLSLGLISYILGIGVSGNTIFAPITQRTYDYVPMYIGLREPQKWIGVLMIVYAVLGGYGVQKLRDYYFASDDLWDRGMLGFLFVLPPLYTPFMLFAGRGQLEARNYPASWYDLKQQIDIQSSCISALAQPCYDILVLPWHMYQSFSFTRGVVAHPIANFFSQQQLLVGDNMEMGALYTQSQRPESKTIEKYIGTNGLWRQGTGYRDPSLYREDLHKLGIHHILLLKEVDYLKYHPGLQYLLDRKILVVEQETPQYIYFRMQ